MLNELKQGKEKLCVIGLGYVGLPLAVAFSKHFSVIGYDQNAEKIAAYRSGIDPSGEISFDDVDRTRITFTDDESALDDAAFYVGQNSRPDAAARGDTRHWQTHEEGEHCRL